MAVFCLLCGKRFQAQSALQQHMEVHAGVRSYICSECNRIPSPATQPSNATCAHTQVGQAGDGRGRVSGNHCLHFPPNTSGGGAFSPPLLKRWACRGLRGAGQRGWFLSCPTLGTFGSQRLCARQRGCSLEMQAPGSHARKLPFSGYTDLGVEVSHLKVDIFAALCIMRNGGSFLLYNFVHFIFFHADSSFQFFSPFRCNFCLL